MNTCSSCGQPVEDTGIGTCPHCGAELQAEGSAGGEGEGQQPVLNSVPFEDRSLPFTTRFFGTVKLAFSNPKVLFSGMQTDDMGTPVLYAVIIGTISGVFGAAWQLFLGSLGTIAERAGFEEFAFHTGFVLVFMVLSPVFALIGLFIGAGIYHVMLLLVGGAKRGFSITLRAVAYGMTPGLLGIVPFCGGIIGGIWSMVLTMMGAIHGQETDGWRAVLAYFLPVIFCCGAGIVLFGMLGVLAGVGN